jgi:hypothetical protein
LLIIIGMVPAADADAAKPFSSFDILVPESRRDKHLCSLSAIRRGEGG